MKCTQHVCFCSSLRPLYSVGRAGYSHRNTHTHTQRHTDRPPQQQQHTRWRMTTSLSDGSSLPLWQPSFLGGGLTAAAHLRFKFSNGPFFAGCWLPSAIPAGRKKLRPHAIVTTIIARCDSDWCYCCTLLLPPAPLWCSLTRRRYLFEGVLPFEIEVPPRVRFRFEASCVVLAHETVVFCVESDAHLVCSVQYSTVCRTV